MVQRNPDANHTALNPAYNAPRFLFFQRPDVHEPEFHMITALETVTRIRVRLMRPEVFSKPHRRVKVRLFEILQLQWLVGVHVFEG
jgi:hypothetical protein